MQTLMAPEQLVEMIQDGDVPAIQGDLFELVHDGGYVPAVEECLDAGDQYVILERTGRVTETEEMLLDNGMSHTGIVFVVMITDLPDSFDDPDHVGFTSEDGEAYIVPDLSR